VSRRSPLHHLHEALGARFTSFGEWEMPLHYTGTLAEHEEVRTGVGVFDVSHLGRFAVTGPEAADLVDRLLCNDLTQISPGRTQYTMMLTPDGGITDDIIVWWVAEDRLLVLPNASNHQRVMSVFVGEATAGVDVIDLQDSTALLAVQGPDAPELLETVVGGAPRRSRVLEVGAGRIVAGTGYTGETGGEVLAPVDDAAALLEEIVAAGAAPCGLGARDTLRLEMGYPLWGQDIDESVTPLEAGLGWAVGWERDFVGREALLRRRDHGVRRLRIGFVLHDRRPPRHGYPLRTAEGEGTVTSGNFSPALGRGIGLGYLSPPPDPGITALEIGFRDRWLPATITDPPFVGR
jgi:aminomethyltransferase